MFHHDLRHTSSGGNNQAPIDNEENDDNGHLITSSGLDNDGGCFVSIVALP
jgi:hypothetical protein